MTAEVAPDPEFIAKPPRTPLQLGIAVVGFTLMIGALGAVFLSHFMPTPLEMKIARGVSAVVALCFAWESRDRGALNPVRLGYQVTGRPNWFIRYQAIRILAMGTFFFFITLVAVEGGLMAVVTAMVGASTVRTVTIDGWSSEGQDRCPGFLVRGAPLLTYDALCADPGLYRTQAVSGRTLLIAGKATSMGMNVETLKLGPVVSAGP